MSPAKKPTTRKSSAKKKASTAATRASGGSSKKKTPKKTSKRKASTRKGGAQTSRSTPKRSAPKKPAPKKTAGSKTTKTTKKTTKQATKATRRPRGSPAKLDAAMLASIRKQLTSEREDLKRQEAELDEESFEGNQAEMMGEIGLDDFADAGTATFERERDLSIRNNIQDLVEQIDHALRRIDEGTYGSCERCGKPIERARLKALPHAVLCLDCKRREERAR